MSNLPEPCRDCPDLEAGNCEWCRYKPRATPLQWLAFALFMVGWYGLMVGGCCAALFGEE